MWFKFFNNHIFETSFLDHLIMKLRFISLIQYGSQLGQNAVGPISKEKKVMSKKGKKDKW